MARVVGVVLVMVVACGSALGQQADPANPAEAGEWIAFCSIQLPKSENAAWRKVVGTMLHKAASMVVAADSAGMKTIDEAAAEAGDGKYVAVWILPPEQAGGEVVVRTLRDLGGAGKHAMVSAAGGEWMGHRGAVDGSHAGMMPGAGIEVAVNINAARHAFEGAFDNWGGHDGRAARVLEAVGLSNARVAGVHVRFVASKDVKTRDPSLPKLSGSEAGAVYAGPMLAVVDATWTARSEPPGKVYRAGLTTDFWPASQMGSGPESGLLCAAAMRVGWRRQLDAALDLYGAELEGAAVNEFALQRRDWASARKASIDRLSATLDPWVGLGLTASDKVAVVVNGRFKADASAAAGVTAVQEAVKGIEGVKESGRWVWEAGPSGARWWVRGAKWVITEDKPPERAGVRAELLLE